MLTRKGKFSCVLEFSYGCLDSGKLCFSHISFHVMPSFVKNPTI